MRQKGKFLTFCFALFPGAGHMYLGFMKMGVSLMVLFWGIMGVAILINLGVLMFILPVIWSYSFFDTLNKNSMDPEEFYQLEDRYLFDMEFAEMFPLLKKKKSIVLAAVFIVIGLAMLASNFMSLLSAILPWGLYWRLETLFQYLPRICIALVIIWIGVRMIRNKQIEIEQQPKEKVFVKTQTYQSENTQKEGEGERQQEWTGTVEDAEKKSEQKDK